MNRKSILAAIGVVAFAVTACTPAAENKAESTEGAMAPADDAMAPADGAMAPAGEAMAPADGAMAPAGAAMAPADGTMTPSDKMAADKMAPAQ